MPQPGFKRKLFYGWWIVLACSGIHLYFGSSFFYGFTALFNPIVEEFGWSYTAVSIAYSLRGLETGFLAPVTGIFADRLGPRKLMLTGVMVMGLGFTLLSRVPNLGGFYAIFVVLSLGLSLVSPVVTMTAVTHWFQKRTSLAMGLVLAGFGAGSLLVPGVVWLVDQAGWRQTVFLFGIGAWVLGIPLALLVKEPKREADALKPRPKAEPNGSNNGLTAREVIRQRNFWLLSTAILFGWLAGSAIIVHQIPYMVSIGVSRPTAGLLATVFGAANLAGRPLFGWAGDCFDPRRCFAGAVLLKGAGVLALCFARDIGQLVPALILLGLGMGGVVPLRAGLQVKFFGAGSFGTIQGLLMIFVTVGTVVAPPLAGWCYDTTGSYYPAFLGLGLATLVAVPLALVMSTKAPVALKAS